MKASWFGGPDWKTQAARRKIKWSLNRLSVFSCASTPPVVKYVQLICQNQTCPRNCQMTMPMPAQQKTSTHSERSVVSQY